MIANEVVESCASTNDLARMLGEAGYPHGTWVSAREQTGGRGRLGRTWQSMRGNLFLSVVVRVGARERWTWIPIAAAGAIADELARERPVSIKWPNDLWLGQAKLGGILCEAVGSKDGAFVIVGIGVNCASAPQGLDQPAASLGLAVDEVRPRVLRAVLGGVEELAAHGPALCKQRYERFAALRPGTWIEWGEDSDGQVRGLGDSGELLVTDRAGELRKLFAEDVKVRPSRREAGGSPA